MAIIEALRQDRSFESIQNLQFTPPSLSDIRCQVGALLRIYPYKIVRVQVSRTLHDQLALPIKLPVTAGGLLSVERKAITLPGSLRVRKPVEVDDQGYEELELAFRTAKPTYTIGLPHEEHRPQPPVRGFALRFTGDHRDVSAIGDRGLRLPVSDLMADYLASTAYGLMQNHA